MDNLKMFFGTLITVNGCGYMIDDAIEYRDNEPGRFDFLVSIRRDEFFEHDETDLLSPYEVMNLIAIADHIIYPNGEVFFRE